MHNIWPCNLSRSWLKSQQRSCKAIEGLSSKIVSTNGDPEQNKINEIIVDLPCNESPELKPSIKLPKINTEEKETEMFSEVTCIQET